MCKLALITGITGQDGAYLSKLLLEKNYKVFGFVREPDDYSKLDLLGIKNKIDFLKCNLLDLNQTFDLFEKINPDEVYNFAAQSSVSISQREPAGTLSFNILSVINLLEAIRFSKKKIKFFHPSSSEMFGNVENLPINENTPFNPLNPYAVSKVSAHMIVKNYRELFGIFACCGILFNHESYLRGNNFFVKKVIRQAIEIKNGNRKALKVGNLNTKRDLGFAPEYVKAMWLMLQKEKADDFLICSGKSVSLQDIVFYVFDSLKIDRKKIVLDKSLFRPFDVEEAYGDSSKARSVLGWKYNMSFFDVLDILIDEELATN